jgi:hypothetical protein
MGRFRVRVSGPLPGNPSEKGEFVITVCRYGDRPGWWISPEEAGPGARLAPLLISGAGC